MTHDENHDDQESARRRAVAIGEADAAAFRAILAAAEPDGSFRKNRLRNVRDIARRRLADRAASPSRGERGTPSDGLGKGMLIALDCPSIAPGTEEGATDWTAQDEAHLQHLSECHDPAWMGEVATRALAALRSSRRREEETRADVRRLEFCFSVAMVLTLPVEDGSIGDGFRIASREDLDAQIRRCDDYHMYDYRKAAR